MGSPPPEGSKKVEFLFRSVSNIVIAPANTGRDNIKSIEVIKIDQIISVVEFIFIIFGFIFMIVEIKLIAPRIEEIPAICNEKIVKSIEAPVWNMFKDSGG